MTNTVAKTYRFSSALYSLIVDESVETKSTEAEVVRLAIRNYFEQKQNEARIDAIENRIISTVETQSNRLAMMIQQVLLLAQPE